MPRSCAARSRTPRSSPSTSAEAKRQPGVALVMTGAELAKLCTGPWVGTLTCFPGMKSAPQYPLAVDRACWVGEPVAMVVARTRAEAEDAAEHIVVEWQELPAVTDKTTALDPGTPVLHPELGDNLAFRKTIDTGAVDAAFAKADLVIEETFEFGRHTAVSLEPRALLAAYDKGTGKLTITTSSQCPHMIQHVFAHTLGVPAAQRADHRARRRRLVRPQDPHLRRRAGGHRRRHPARPPGQVHRRPPGIVRVRHPRAREPRQGAHRREQVRHDRGLRHRRAVGRRRLFAIPAHQRVRGHPGAQHHRRPLPAQALPGARHRGLSEQGADLAVSRRRPPDRQHASASTWSIRPPTGSASIRSRCAGATSCPTTAIPRPAPAASS